MRTSLIRALAVIGAVGALGCYPSRIESIEDFDTATTIHAPGVSFTGVGTYGIPDSIREFGDPDDEVDINHGYDAAVIANIKANLNALGWTEVNEDSLQPDILVAVGVTTTTNTGWAVGWWDWYYWWWGGWGWYYPPVYYPYSYQSGTLLIGMLDTRGTTGATTDVPVVWVAAANGVLRSTASANATVINGLVDQAFEQSPYLDGSVAP